MTSDCEKKREEKIYREKLRATAEGEGYVSSVTSFVDYEGSDI